MMIRRYVRGMLRFKALHASHWPLGTLSRPARVHLGQIGRVVQTDGDHPRRPRRQADTELWPDVEHKEDLQHEGSRGG